MRWARSARRTIALTVILSIAITVVVVAIALTLASALGDLVTGDRVLAETYGDIATVAGLFALRAVLQVALGRVGHIGATDAIADLRSQALSHMSRLGPRWATEHAAKTGTLLTRGLDALDPYFTSYLPQLILTVVLTPALLVVMATQDFIAAVTLVIAIPLIPIFMWLIGVMTSQFAADRLAALTNLGRQLLDLVAGIPTLKAFGRAFGPAARVRDLAARARRTTMTTLRVAFLSGAVLELISTIAVAMVAVGVGLRLVNGQFSLVTGLAVLIMAPEVLMPLRQVGVQFHNAADGVAAAEAALDVIAETAPATGSTPVPAVTRVEVRGVSVRAGERDRIAPHDLSFTLERGAITALAGPSGSGKTTAMNVVLGLLTPDSGTVTLHTVDGPMDLADADLESWWAQLTWVAQRPTFEPATLGELLGGKPEERERAVTAAGLADLIDVVGWDKPIGQGGYGLSVGQAQRLALARALMSPAPFLILDEPTAHLDTASEEVVVATLDAARRAGKGVLVIAHRTAVLDIADSIVHTAVTHAG